MEHIYLECAFFVMFIILDLIGLKVSYLEDFFFFLVSISLFIFNGKHVSFLQLWV